MRNIFYCFLLALFILGCRKEDSLEVQLELRDLYAITDNPNDSIQHRIWEIYDKYHVPVYFNDTIAKEFMKIDVYGDTVWRYETVDMAWTFDGNEGRTYTYSYMTDPKEQMFALDIVEKLLTDASPTLYPYSIFIADSALAVNDNGRTSWNGGAYSVGYKTLLMTGNWEDDPANVLENIPFEIIKSSLQNKILNFEAELQYFYGASNVSWYDKEWTNLTGLTNEYDFFSLFESYWEDPNHYNDWWGPYHEQTFNGTDYYLPDDLELARADLRSVMGRYGFVAASPELGMNTPQTTTQDLQTYINEILNHPDDFETLWGGCSLVMEKYNILMEIIEGEMGVVLRNVESN